MGSIHREPDEILQNHIKHMGEKLGTYFNALWKEVAWVYTKWSEYDELFGKKPSRVDLLNDAAPTFFHIVQDCLFKDILLHIARLTDPPKSVGKKNLSVRGFPGLISSDTLKNEVENLIDAAIQKADFCRDWRNRKLAHKDLKLSLSDEAVPLKPASREKVKDVLEHPVQESGSEKAISGTALNVWIDLETGLQFKFESFYLYEDGSEEVRTTRQVLLVEKKDQAPEDVSGILDRVVLP